MRIPILSTALLIVVVAAPAWGESEFEAAWRFCKAGALDQLKAPATARFDNITIKRLKPPNIGVSFSLDAQNSFGALLRVWGLCVYHQSGGRSFVDLNDVWKDQVLLDAADSLAYHLPPE